jgi:hypothetical protein
MGDCVNISLNNQTFKTDAVVIGSNARGPAVAGLTVYGDISASGRVYGTDTGFVKIRLTGNGGREYELPFYPSSNAADYIVSVDGVLQEAIHSYTVTNSTPRKIIFTEIIEPGAAIMILVVRALMANSTNVPTFKKNQFTTSYFVFRYTLTFFSNENPTNYLVYLDGVMQSPQEDYVIQGNEIVLITPPSDNQKLLVMSLQNADGTYATTMQPAIDPNRMLPLGASNGHTLIYKTSLNSWIADYLLPTNATSGQVLTWNGTAWVAQTVSTNGTGTPIGPAVGDLGGVYPGPSVTKIQGWPVSNAAPAASNVLTWDGTTGSWMPSASPVSPLPTNATDGQVLTYDGSVSNWKAATLNFPETKAGGMVIFDQPGARTWTVPAYVKGVRVHVIGGGGGVGSTQQNGGDSTFNVTVSSIPIAVTAKGGLAGTSTTGGKGGDVAQVAARTNINFTGVGAGAGGQGGGTGTKGRAGTGSAGGYGGGGGGGTGGSTNNVDSVPVGSISWYAASAVPPNYLECNGDIVNISDYPDLYNVIGTTYNYRAPILEVGTIARESTSAYDNANNGTATLTFRMDDGPVDQGVVMVLRQGIGNITKTAPRGTSVTFTGLDEHYGNMLISITDTATGATWEVTLSVSTQRLTYKSSSYTAGQTITLEMTSLIPESKFRIPDLRGEFIRGWDNKRGADANRVFASNQKGSHIPGDDGNTPAAIGIGKLSECNFDPSDNVNRSLYYIGSALTHVSTFFGQTRPRNVALLPCIKATKSASNLTDTTGGGGGGAGFGGGGGGGASGIGGKGAGYGGSGKSDVRWGDAPGGYGGGAAAPGYAAGGGGGYAAFSLDVVPGGIVSLTIGAGGTTGVPGADPADPGAIIIEW